MGQTISEPTTTENSWIEEQLNVAVRFVSSYSLPDSDKPLALDALDKAFKSWLASNPAPEMANGVVNAVGIAFGDSLVRSGAFRWVIVSDEYGTDLAVRALPGQGDVLVFPADFVTKRWERHEADFLGRSFAEIMASVRSIRDEWQSHKPKLM